MIFNMTGTGNDIDLPGITAAESDVIAGRVMLKRNGEIGTGTLEPDKIPVHGSETLAYVVGGFNIPVGAIVKYYYYDGYYRMRLYENGTATDNVGVCPNGGTRNQLALLVKQYN